MRFWVDMDNAPHVHVLRPIVVELQRRGHRVDITARDYGQTLPLLALYGLDARCIGRHVGKNKLLKYVAFATRTVSLFFFALGRRYDAAFSHGARSIVPAAKVLGIPLVALGDYEHTSFPRLMKSWIRLHLVPDVIPPEAIGGNGPLRNRSCAATPGSRRTSTFTTSRPTPPSARTCTSIRGLSLSSSALPPRWRTTRSRRAQSFLSRCWTISRVPATPR